MREQDRGGGYRAGAKGWDGCLTAAACVCIGVCTHTLLLGTNEKTSLTLKEIPLCLREEEAQERENVRHLKPRGENKRRGKYRAGSQVFWYLVSESYIRVPVQKRLSLRTYVVSELEFYSVCKLALRSSTETGMGQREERSEGWWEYKNSHCRERENAG